MPTDRFKKKKKRQIKMGFHHLLAIFNGAALGKTFKLKENDNMIKIITVIHGNLQVSTDSREYLYEKIMKMNYL